MDTVIDESLFIDECQRAETAKKHLYAQYARWLMENCMANKLTVN